MISLNSLNSKFFEALTAKTIAVAPRIVATVIILIILNMIVKFSARKIGGLVTRKTKDSVIPEDNIKRISTISNLAIKTLSVILWGIGVTIILNELGINIGPILTAAGIFGLAVSFGSQNLIKDLVGGIFVMIEDQIRIGDSVIVGGKEGTVESINLRSIVIRDVSGALHSLGNGTFGTITNMSRLWSAYTIEVPVAIGNDPDKVIAVFKKVDDEIRQANLFEGAIKLPLEIVGLDRFAGATMVFKARVRTKPGLHVTVGHEYNLRLKKAFDAEGISFPTV